MGAGLCFGWLRSPNSNNSNNACDVNNGYADNNDNVNNPNNGAVPDLLLSQEKSQLNTYRYMC